MSWAAVGAAEAARLTRLLDDNATGPVHHIGSTAVPGLCAKPILDFAVASTDRHATAEQLGEQLGGDWALIPDGLHPLPVRLLVHVVRGRRHTHLQVMDLSDPHLGRLLAFRDALRCSPEARDAYSAAKREAALAHRDDRQSYTDAKVGVIAETLRRVGVAPAD
jgi:GrpB-like predicted nucleotidyltransferase (UPF0157 family)